MNKLLLYVACLVTLTFNVSCQNNSGSNSNNGTPGTQAITPTAPVPTNFCLMNPSYGYQSNQNAQCYYNYQPYQGFYNYNYYGNTSPQATYQNGFCGCPSSSRPIYNSSWGLGCVDPRYTYSTNTNNYYLSFGWNSTNTQWLNIPQIPTQYPTNGNCYSDAVLSCDINNPNSCGYGAICKPVNNSPIGICQSTGAYNYGAGYR